MYKLFSQQLGNSKISGLGKRSMTLYLRGKTIQVGLIFLRE